MSERARRAGAMAAGAVALGGLLVALFPEHAAAVVQLTVITIAAAVGFDALVSAVPEWRATRWLRSPFNRDDPMARRWRHSDELDRIRWGFSRRRQRVRGGPPLTPQALHQLQPLIRTALLRRGLDPEDPDHRDAARELLSPLTLAVADSEPLRRKDWYLTLPGNERQVADVVHRILDDLDRLASEGFRPDEPSRTPEPR